MVLKRDLFGHKERYDKWKADVVEGEIVGLTKRNSELVIQHVLDMELGINISIKNKKGARSYPRLNNIRQRLAQIFTMLQKRGISDITKIKEKQLIQLFSDMRSGIIKTRAEETYRSVGDYAKVFTSFWHWWMKINRKKGKQIIDIAEELDKSCEKSKFVYITKEQLDQMLPYFIEDEQILLMFTFDSIIRAPTELFSLRAKDFYKKGDVVWVNVPAEVSKTHFERSFNLLYVGDAIWKYIERNNINPEDYVFNLNHQNLTAKMQQVARKLFGHKLSDPKAGGCYDEISLYDLRHSGAIHLRVLAQKTKKISLDALRQRGGWVDFKMLNHYTQFIGLDGSIDKEDLLIEEDKSRLERKVEKLEKSDKRLSAVIDLIMNNPEALKALTKSKEKLIEVMAMK